MNIGTKYNIDEEVQYLNMQGKLTVGRIETILINVGTSVTRTTHWVETERTPVKTGITYKLYAHPQGFTFNEDSLFEYKKEEVNAG